MSRGGRAAAVGAFAVAGLLFALVLYTAEDEPAPLWFAVAWCLSVGAMSWLLAFRPWIGIDGDSLYVVNPIRRVRIALRDITNTEPGYSGISITLRNGRTRTAWAVQKANIMWLFRKRTRADNVAEAIRQTASRLQDDLDPSDG